MSDTVLGLLLRQIDEEKASVLDALATGGAADYATYKEMCGQLRAFERSRGLVEVMIERLRKQEDL